MYACYTYVYIYIYIYPDSFVGLLRAAQKGYAKRGFQPSSHQKVACKSLKKQPFLGSLFSDPLLGDSDPTRVGWGVNIIHRHRHRHGHIHYIYIFTYVYIYI